MSHHPRCGYARSSERARKLALRLDPPPVLRDQGMDVALMTDQLATLIDLACPPECINGRCRHQPKVGGEVLPE